MSHRGQPPPEDTNQKQHTYRATSTTSQLPHASHASATAQPSPAFSHYYSPSSMTYAPRPPHHYGHHYPPSWDYSLPSSEYPRARLPYPQQPLSLPTLSYYAPETATPGDKIYVYLHSHVKFEEQAPIYFTIMFQGIAAHADVHSIGQKENGLFEYAVSAYVPNPNYTSTAAGQIQLSLDMRDVAGHPLGLLDLGDFWYADSTLYHDVHRSEASRKRKWEQSSYPSSLPSSAVAGPSYQYFPAAGHHSLVPGLEYSGGPASQAFPSHGYTPSYSSYVPQKPLDIPAHLPSSSSAPSLLNVHGHVEEYLGRGRTDEQKSPVRKRSRGPWTQPREPLSRTASQPSVSTKSSRGSRSKGALSPAPSDSGNPPLVRTSTMANPPGPVAGTQTTPDFNPYSIYPTKVTLEFEGELEDMLRDWTEDEQTSKRRLVQFERTQADNILSVSFKAVAPKERKPKSICVSCIWWEEKQEAFVTSVDTINLLQSLIGARFTVEEKNRTRRNLEGFKPLTIAKSKPDSASFFRTIMGYSNPRPRNIEKDVKVFPWTILPLALKKVIAKYSPDYASTAGILAQPGASDETAEQRVDDELGEGQSSLTSSPPLSDIPTKTPSRQDIAQAAASADSTAPPLGMYMPPADLPTRSHPHRHMPDDQLEQQQAELWDFGAYVHTDLVATPSLNPDNDESSQAWSDPSGLGNPEMPHRRHL